MSTLLFLLAQTTAPAASQPAAPSAMDIFRGPFVPLMLAVVVFFWWSSRGRNKEKQKFQQMLDSLKKNDRVQTIGGVLGTVVDVRDNEVVLKVDEASNTKMRFNRSAIKEVLRDAPAPDQK
jgi:preprotein translocase subunit YajC